MKTKGLFLRVNTPGTRGGPGGRDQTLAMKKRKATRKSVNFQPWEFPRSGSKAKDGEKKKKILQGLRVVQAAVTERWP